jgi:hypothetical protein
MKKLAGSFSDRSRDQRSSPPLALRAFVAQNDSQDRFLIALAINAPHPHLSSRQGRHSRQLSASSPLIRDMFSLEMCLSWPIRSIWTMISPTPRKQAGWRRVRNRLRGRMPPISTG